MKITRKGIFIAIITNVVPLLGIHTTEAGHDPPPLSSAQITQILSSPDRTTADRTNDLRRKPEQMLGFNLSPSLHWGKAKKDGKLMLNKQLGELGYALQFSTLLAFRTVGMALEQSLKTFRHRGLDALADLQLAEMECAEEPRTRMHQKFAGTNRWLTLEKVSRGA